MIIQEERVSEVQRYRNRGGLCTAQRFFQNWSEESVVREVERKDFFSRRTAIFTLFRNSCSTASLQETEIA